MYLLGYDVGSSSIKASVVDARTGRLVGSATSPDRELEISAPEPGWAEQDPAVWWEHLGAATTMLRRQARIDLRRVEAIGISYQMHGLVVVDRVGEVLRPAIIWCDSRAVDIGDRAFAELGSDLCLSRLLNSPGNFTASKLRWVKENEPEVFERIDKIMLPGDYIGFRLTGDIVTTPSGLSEGILWDYRQQGKAQFLLDYYGIPFDMLPTLLPTFSVHGEVTKRAAEELGLKPGTKVSYRAGDQPNNAMSLNVLEPGEVAATAGTSGVVYGVGDQAAYDERSRVNVFVHVNNSPSHPRYGTLLCINGTGILNSWLKRTCMAEDVGYDEMNALAENAPIGSDGLVLLPFGNGAERSLENRNIGASVRGLGFNTHGRSHLLRAAQEGIVFALMFGFEIMHETGVHAETVRAGYTNMFLSPLFAQSFSTVTGTRLELLNTDGAQGAARGASIGCGLFSSVDAFAGLETVRVLEPDRMSAGAYAEAYRRWKSILLECLSLE